MTPRKPTLAERVASLEDWFAEANQQAAEIERAKTQPTEPEPEPESEETLARRAAEAQLGTITNAKLLIARDRVTNLLEAELDKSNPSTLRIRNLAHAISELERWGS